MQRRIKIGTLNHQNLAIKESWRLDFHFFHKQSKLEPQDVLGNPTLLTEKKVRNFFNIVLKGNNVYIGNKTVEGMCRVAHLETKLLLHCVVSAILCGTATYVQEI